MANRKGMGRGTGKGYKNILGNDKSIHSQSARGIKQPQRIGHISTNSVYEHKYFTIYKSQDYIFDEGWVNGYTIHFKPSLSINTTFRKTLNGAIKYGKNKTKNIKSVSDFSISDLI